MIYLIKNKRGFEMKNEINKLNKPLYYYHLVSKDVDISEGLLSLKYMYEHELFDLFDANVSKYKERIGK